MIRFLSKTNPKVFKNKCVILKVDYNVSISKGRITELYRILKTFETIRYLLNAGTRHIILVSYLGRPDGKVVPSLSLEPVARALSKLLKHEPISFIGFSGSKGKKPFKLSAVQKSEIFRHAADSFGEKGKSRITLLENVRFFPEEEKCDLRFARQLAMLGDVYVNEAFSTSHRAHASVVGIPKFLPTYYGFQFEREIKMLSEARNKPRRPLLVILGGAKLETKMPLISFFMKHADKVILGGKLLNEFLANEKKLTKGWVGKQRKKFLWPVDFKVLSKGKERIVSGGASVKYPKIVLSALDMGLATLDLILREVDRANTVIWNGPLGKFEDKRFAVATEMLARHLIKHSHNKYILIGGGDTLTVLDKMNAIDKFHHVSTGGGAMLEFLAKGKIIGFKK